MPEYQRSLISTSVVRWLDGIQSLVSLSAVTKRASLYNRSGWVEPELAGIPKDTFSCDGAQIATMIHWFLSLL